MRFGLLRLAMIGACGGLAALGLGRAARADDVAAPAVLLTPDTSDIGLPPYTEIYGFQSPPLMPSDTLDLSPPINSSDDALQSLATLSHTALSADPPSPLMADLGDDSVYAPAPPPRADEGVNNGAVHLNLKATWVNDYVYRGVNHDQVATHHADSLNLLFDGQLSFDTGKYPHPFVGLFTNIYDSDPLSRFEEVRPYIGADWNLRPFLFEFEQITYIYPEREEFNTSEVNARLELDDSLMFHTDKPIFSPYVLAAFEYHLNEGWYIEAGVHHDFAIEDTGLTLTPRASVAWISGLNQQFVFINTTRCTGWQHMEVGMDAVYSLNDLMNVSRRYGEFDVDGYVYYDEKLSANITANNVVWAGIGIGFKY